MDDNAERKRNLYFKNLRKEQKKRRKERKKQEKVARESELQRERFEKLVSNITSKLQAGEKHVHEDEKLFSESKQINLGACSRTKPNCTATTFAEAETLANAQTNTRKAEPERSKAPQGLKRLNL